MNVYFKNIPYVGDMTLEYVFYAYDEPILFVCTDIQGTRYLCSCCKLSEEWAVAQVTEKALLEMLDDRIPLDEVFRSCKGVTFVLRWDGERFHQQPGTIPEELLPEPGAFLDLSDAGEYREHIQRAARKRTRRVMAPSHPHFLSWTLQSAISKSSLREQRGQK